jgi:hypothetical protein
MTTEGLMRVYIVDTDYSDLKNIQDVPAIPFLNCRNPLYIGAKDQQIRRMRRAIKQEKLGGIAAGFWELNGNPGFVTKKGDINWSKFKEHDVVFLTNPSRVHESKRVVYERFVELLKAKL